MTSAVDYRSATQPAFVFLHGQPGAGSDWNGVIAGLPSGSRVGVVCGSHRGVDNIAEVLALAGASGVAIISAVAHTEPELDQVDREATLILLSREAMALGLESRFERPERIREWSYEFDPAAFELLRRAIERVGVGAGGEAGGALEPVAG